MSNRERPPELVHCVPAGIDIPTYRPLSESEIELVDQELFRRSGLRHAHEAGYAFHESHGPAILDSPEGIDADGWTRSDSIWNRARASGSFIYGMMDCSGIREWTARDLGSYYSLLLRHSQFFGEIDFFLSLEFQAIWHLGVESGHLVRYELKPDPRNTRPPTE